jgi:hypothetical protein
MKVLATVGIVLLLSVLLLIGWVYSGNPSDFGYNIAVPLFDGILLGLASLGVISVALARVPLKRQHAMAIGVAFLLVPVAVLLLGSMTSETACFDPGVSCPVTGDIVNGPETVGPGRSNSYQFSIPYGVQDLSVHLQWSSGGRISVYVMNATELISWLGGQRLQAYYSSAESQGYANLRLPAGNLYYLVFSNPLPTFQEVVQTDSGFSYMCGGSLCGTVGGPVQQLNPSAPSCVGTNGSEDCSVTLTNFGSAETSPTGTCVESWAVDEGPLMTWGTPHLGVFAPTTPITPSSNLTGTCTVAGATAPLGLAITVLIPFVGGYNVMMYGPVSLNAPTCTQSGTQLVCTFVINNDVMPGVFAIGCQIQVGDNVTRWTGILGGTTTFDAAHRGNRFTCSVTGSEPSIGTPVSGYVRFGDGSYAIFSSKWT